LRLGLAPLNFPLPAGSPTWQAAGDRHLASTADT
jgi:hypothetical protein